MGCRTPGIPVEYIPSGSNSSFFREKIGRGRLIWIAIKPRRNEKNCLGSTGRLRKFISMMDLEARHSLAVVENER